MLTSWWALASGGRRCWVRSGALLSLALLALVSAAHFKHHLDDPECGRTPVSSHVCFCAGLHSGVLGESAVTGPSSAPAGATIITSAPCVRVASEAPAAGTPRAPPPA